jgi:hypothetical protein
MKQQMNRAGLKNDSDLRNAINWRRAAQFCSADLRNYFGVVSAGASLWPGKPTVTSRVVFGAPVPAELIAATSNV